MVTLVALTWAAPNGRPRSPREATRAADTVVQPVEPPPVVWTIPDIPPLVFGYVQVSKVQYVPPEPHGVYAAEQPAPFVPPLVVLPDPPPTTTGDAAHILRGTPLEPYAGAMEAAAARYGIDPRLLAVIAIKESSGGLHTCGFNAWGYGNCEGASATMFVSWEAAIEFVTVQLADASPYVGLETADKLCVWRSGQRCAAGDPGRAYAVSAMALFP